MGVPNNHAMDVHRTCDMKSSVAISQPVFYHPMTFPGSPADFTSFSPSHVSFACFAQPYPVPKEASSPAKPPVAHPAKRRCPSPSDMEAADLLKSLRTESAPT